MRSRLDFLDQPPGERAPSKDQHALAGVTKAPDAMTQAQSEQEGDNDRQASHQEASVKRYSGGKAVDDAQQMDALPPFGSCRPEPCRLSRSFCPTVNLPVVTLNSVNPPKSMRNFPERWLGCSPSGIGRSLRPSQDESRSGTMPPAPSVSSGFIRPVV